VQALGRLRGNESFTGRLCDELLSVEILHTILESKIMEEDYRQHYNRYRRIPRSATSPPTISPYSGTKKTPPPRKTGIEDGQLCEDLRGVGRNSAVQQGDHIGAVLHTRWPQIWRERTAVDESTITNNSNATAHVDRIKHRACYGAGNNEIGVANVISGIGSSNNGNRKFGVDWLG
jgi:hypothetical protein